ncbi:hypothetical protein RHSIM_Rhsim07G0235200 [Rhododendron simsii]|uniref:Pathogenesis-related protein 5 n=1 Tax=Rhododendron simsii TaxID=118357 RepID=A0A834H0Q6_RHOSS|nr:hypothetical protein RHSIM_Rhsim07G0235200 [Rhododendron simsii]
MAMKHRICLLLAVALAIFFFGARVSAIIFTLENRCSYTIWPGTLSGSNGVVLGGGGFTLVPGTSTQFPAPPAWSGRFWARTGCSFDASGNGTCTTGDCGGKLQCTGGGVPPVTLAEFTVGGGTNTMDFYDVSLVDGYGCTMWEWEYGPPAATGTASIYAGCITDVNRSCPRELQVTSAGSVVACKSACAAFSRPEYCCTGPRVSATVFTLENNCSYTIWAGTLCGNGVGVLGGGGFALAPGASTQFPAPTGWSGRFWARTDCNFDGLSNGACATGDCGGSLQCTGSGVPPATLAEFTLNGWSGMDFYDVSLMDGYNVGIGIQTSGGTGDCKYAGCIADLNAICPPELQVTNAGSVVACKSACEAFNTPQYCCTGNYSTPVTCPPTQYSELFKQACPDAYSYAYDDASSTFTCTGANYLITFCPQ